jgi:hypothetical protein
MIGEGADQWYLRGTLSRDDITECRGMLNWGPVDRQDCVTYEPDSREAQVLRKIFKYRKEDERIDKWTENHDEGEMFERVPVETLLDEPCFVVTFQDW